MKEDTHEQPTPPREDLFGGGECPQSPVVIPDTIEELREALTRETEQRRRADCMARMQSSTMQLALDSLITEPDIDGFFRVFMKTLLEETDSHACGVFLLDDDATRCQLWTSYGSQPDWDELVLPHESMSEHLFSYRPGWTTTIEYTGDDPRLPEPVRAFNHSIGLQSLDVTPLLLPNRNLGWIALSAGDAPPEWAPWRRALMETIARQATLALHQSRLAEQSRVEARRQAVLEERNRIARDIHDTLAQGFAAILMQLQSTQRAAASMPKSVASSIENAIDLARTNMIEARRSVCTLRPQTMESGDFGSVLERTVELARRTTDVPIELVIEELPGLGANVERELASIAQEALTNAVRHARARKIVVRAAASRGIGFRLSVADDGKGIAKERFGSGFGLTSMQERAERIGAELTIVTAPRAGTEIVLAWEPASFTIPPHDRQH